MKLQTMNSIRAPRHLQVLAGPSPRLARQLAARRKGVALVYATLGLAAFLGATALVVDMGSLYTRRAQAQRAADAAALAGAWDLKKDADGTAAMATAKSYAALNGYQAPAATVDVSIASSAGGASNNRVVVNVQKRERLFFLPAVLVLIGAGNQDSSLVGAHATAETQFASEIVKLRVGDAADYGSARGVANPSVFGPDSRYEYGDAFSPNTIDGTIANPGRGSDTLAGSSFGGYEYHLNIPQNYIALNGSSEVQLELFDPDCFVTTANQSNSLLDWDELHVGNNATNLPTVTLYQLFSPKGVKIAEATYGGDPNDPKDVDANLKWTTPDGFIFDISNPNNGVGEYVIKVKALSGVSENGFQFRAGPKRDDPASLRTASDADTTAWVRDYDRGGRVNGATGNGTDFTAAGKTPFNFTTNGTVTVALGEVPGLPLNSVINIDKFDTDVGAKSIGYFYLKKDGTRVDIARPGTLSSDGTWQLDSLTVGDANSDVPSYPPDGAVWYATYAAGAYDTSTWKMDYSGTKRENPQVRLID